MNNTALEWWQGEDGKKYADRNMPTSQEIMKRAAALTHPLNQMVPLDSILEVGCNVGANLSALHEALSDVQLYAIEPNEYAAEVAKKRCPYAIINDGHASAICAADNTFDLVFTAGVLIHVPPDKLSLAMDEIIRVSKKYVMCIEYFAPNCEPVQYYGAERIWRNDFGKLYMEKGLTPVAHGFFWRPEGAYDNTIWHVLKKS